MITRAQVCSTIIVSSYTIFTLRRVKIKRDFETRLDSTSDREIYLDLATLNGENDAAG